MGTSKQRTRAVNIALFVEGSFYPSYDGHSMFMKNFCLALERHIDTLVIIHCYRGWSNVKEMKRLFRCPIYLLPSKDYYKNNELIREILRKHEIQSVYMTDSQLIIQQGYPIKKENPQTKIFYGVPALPFYLIEQFGGKKNTITVNRSIERCACTISDAIFCFSNEDKERLKNLGIFKEKIFVRKPIIRVPRKAPYHNRKPNLLFLGNMFFEPNAKAVRYIINNIAPSLAKGVTVKIVGDIPRELRALCETRTNIKVIGRKKSLARIFQTSALALAPIKEGSGVRSKILDCSAHGIPTVAFEEALEGIPKCMRDYCYIFPENTDSGLYINQLLKQRRMLEIRSQQVFTIMKKEYNADHVMREILSVVRRVKSSRLTRMIYHPQLPDTPPFINELLKKRRFRKRFIPRRFVMLHTQ